MQHVILGAGGVIANDLAKELLAHGESVRLVSRTAKPMSGATAIAADLLNAQSVNDAVRGADIVYLTVGLLYRAKVWAEQWPVVMRNTIAACEAHQAKLVFFDNVYMYGKVVGKMTEATPFNPNSKKGEVRARIVTDLFDATKRGNLTALVARSADFYGPETPNSMLTSLLFENLAKGKKAQLILDADIPHSYTFTSDMGKALYLLAKDATAYNQTWHLPTKNPPLTGRQIVEQAAAALDVAPKFSILGNAMMAIGGLFDPLVKEFKEMLYQYDSEYWFDSTKFEQHFNFTPTDYADGIRETALWYQQKSK